MFLDRMYGDWVIQYVVDLIDDGQIKVEVFFVMVGLELLEFFKNMCDLVFWNIGVSVLDINVDKVF